MPTREADQPIRILHLSDIHFTTSKRWDADPVLRTLARFVKTEVEEGLAPDLVILSGDLAFSGGVEEYALARDWLENQLWPALPGKLPRDRLLLVPGNHDVDRKKVSRGVRSMQDGLLNARTQDEIAALLGDDDDRNNILRRHAGYMDFVAGWYGEAQPMPWWQRLIEINGARLHMAGLNSAWMCCGDEDRSRLLLGRYQLTQTVMAEEAEGADWRIAVMHHPWEYLAEFDHQPSRSAVHHHCDLLLRGHLHQTRPERVVPPDPSRQCLELAAGCVYETSEYPNGFQWIELAPRKKLVRVLFRAWLHDAWAVDRNLPGCPAGRTQFDLGTHPPVGPGRGRSAAPMIPPDYLAWLKRHCADVALLGQDIQQGHAFTLSHVYVPALSQLDTAAAMEIDESPTAKENFEILEDLREILKALPIGEFWKKTDEILKGLWIEESPTATNIDEVAKEIWRLRKPERKLLVPLLTRLNSSSLYVPAPAGAGKSTFCRWAVLQSIEGGATAHPVPVPGMFRERVPESLRTHLPLLVPLRDFALTMACGRGLREWKRGDLEQALAAWVDTSPPPGLDGALVRDHLAAGSTLLLLDGLDEVPVSEGRDGATAYPRSLLLSGLADALHAWEAAGNRTLLTSRPYGLDEAGLARLGLARAPLAPLPKALQELFVTRWFYTLGRPERSETLLAAMQYRDDLGPLTENPMLLTAVCVLYDKGGRLPEDRYQLYKSIIDGVLHSRYPGDARQREPVLRRLEAIAHGMHTGEPGAAARQTPAAEISWVETERLLAHFAGSHPAYGRDEVDAAVLREELLTRSGLLLPRPNERAAFHHLSFQEFLAAQRIARRGDARVEEVICERGSVPEWRPTLAFLFAAQIFNGEPEWGLDLLARLTESQDRAAVAKNPAMAQFVAEALELCLAKGYRVPEGLAGGFCRLVLHAIEDEIALPARQALGLSLGRFGDPRLFDLREPSAYVVVPAGTYASGARGDPIKIRVPFRIGRYPVTNGQYTAFMDAGGYRDWQWWSEAGWTWLQGTGVTEPASWRDRRWNCPNQPVIGVSFFEAEACAAWAGGRLPTEKEWEAAARGPESYEYPWGNDWRDGICNTREAGLHVSSPVGLFPSSRQARLVCKTSQAISGSGARAGSTQGGATRAALSAWCAAGRGPTLRTPCGVLAAAGSARSQGTTASVFVL